MSRVSLKEYLALFDSLLKVYKNNSRQRKKAILSLVRQCVEDEKNEVAAIRREGQRLTGEWADLDMADSVLEEVLDAALEVGDPDIEAARENVIDELVKQEKGK